MRYDFTHEYVELIATPDEYTLIRAAAKKRLIRAATVGERLGGLEAWRLTDFLENTTSKPVLIRANCEELPYYRDALAAELLDLDDTELKLAQGMVIGMTVACEGFKLLQNQVAIPNFLPENF